MALLCMVTTIMYAQTIVATGQGVDQTGETIIGATVMEKGTTNGSITDFDGNFTITVKKGATLVVSYIGFNNQELPAAQGMKITLKEDAQSLQEVVVTGYTTQRKADLTGSVAVVGTPSITKSGSCEELNEPIPRILTVPVPEGEPSVVTVIPATFPCNALIGSLSEEVLRSFVCTTATEPVRSALRCVV